MSVPPTVLLSPRAAVRLPSGLVDIPPPPLAPPRPGRSLVYEVLPVLLAAIGVGFILVVGALRSSGSGMGVLLVASLLLVGGGAGFAVMMHRAQQAAYRRATRERLELYERMLISTRERLRQLLGDQRALLLAKDPDPVVCQRLAVQRAGRLWERSPADADFLTLRVGLGSQASSVPVRAPQPPDLLQPDPLIQAARTLADWATSVWCVPVGLALVDGHPVGICGPRTSVLDTVRALIVQLATHHAPDEVKIVALVPPAEYAAWAWLRWLPHAWSDDRRERYIARTPAEAASLSRRLEELLGRRFQALSPYALTNARSTSPLPVYIFLIADEALADNMPVLARASVGQDGRVGASCVFLSTDRSRLPRACRTIVDVADGHAAGRLTEPNGDSHSISWLDHAPLPLVEQFAAALAPLRVRRIASSSALPAQAPLLDLLGVTAVEELDVLTRWQHGLPHLSLAVPIGVRPGGEALTLDLHETADGPHGLIAGSTGSGKSALLQALLLGLAVSFHPHDVGMVLVDVKGGGSVGPLRGLPHLLGTITNLDGKLARRALIALRAEIARRQALVAAAECDDLDTYLARRRRDRTLEPLPHLMLAVDEFAELQAERPDFIRQLVRIARLGRTVGFHLILATHKPHAAIDDEIWANARFRICLRVEQPQDSQDVLKRPDAASLAGRGQAYLQVGHDEIFTVFQAAWGGAAYRPQSSATNPNEILRVDLDGTRRAANIRESELDGSREPIQADVLARHVRHAASAAHVDQLPPIWPAPSPDLVLVPRLLDADTG